MTGTVFLRRDPRWWCGCSRQESVGKTARDQPLVITGSVAGLKRQASQVDGPRELLKRSSAATEPTRCDLEAPVR
jgi:hypothetical protein